MQFVRACPAPGCRGFLSTSWECGICDVSVCSQCYEIKAEDTIHICNPDILATARLLAKDTKPCPKCGVLIHKLEGCDQSGYLLPIPILCPIISLLRYI